MRDMRSASSLKSSRSIFDENRGCNEWAEFEEHENG